MPDGLVLSAIVDTSGYSSSVQERYQAYLLLDTPALFGGKRLEPSTYGCGFVNGEFLVLDLSGARSKRKLIFNVRAQHDAEIKRSTPLQVVADTDPGKYRLYFGRNYVWFAAAGQPVAQ